MTSNTQEDVVTMEGNKTEMRETEVRTVMMIMNNENNHSDGVRKGKREEERRGDGKVGPKNDEILNRISKKMNFKSDTGSTVAIHNLTME